MQPGDTLRKEIEKARLLFDAHGADLLSDGPIAALLSAYAELIEAGGRFMRESGVADACARCAARTGSCCFDGIEAGYDSVLLLVNLLLGCTLPCEREIPGGCHFAGEEGCKLVARYAFCLNYLCPDLAAKLGGQTKGELLRTIGAQLAKGWEVEAAIRTKLRERKSKNEA